MLRQRRGAVPRHHRLRRHRHPRDQHRPARRARHALSRREGPGQEPADAVAGPLPRRGDPVPRHPRLPGPRRPVPARSPRAGKRVRRRARPRTRCRSPGGRASERYAERLAPGTKFADIIGEIDPAKLAGGTSMSAEEALHFGLIPRMHRGIFAMNELPELDELVQVGLFNILEERDVQIRGYPIQFDIDVLILFSANPATYNRSGKVIPQLKDRIGSLIHTHYPLRARPSASRSWSRRPGIDLGGEFPVRRAVLHEGDHRADQRRGPQVEVHRSAVRRQRPLQHRQLPHDGRQRPAARRACWARSRPCRGSATWATSTSSSLGKLELDMMGSHQMSRAAGARRDHRRGDRDGVRGVRRQARPGGDRRDLRQGREDRGRRHAAVGALRRAAASACRRRGTRRSRSTPATNEAVRASCVEFVLAGLYASDRISRVAEARADRVRV